MGKILVIGSVSLDTIYLRTQRYRTVGGAGMYTSLAAACAGAEATLVAPRPDVTPLAMEPVARSMRWIGPRMAADQLPRLEIKHHGDGKATLLDASWGGTSALTPDSLPHNLDDFDVIHVSALPSAKHQLEFVRHIKRRSTSKVSVGTYAKLVYGETATVRKAIDTADLFFMNANEACGLFGDLDTIHLRTDQLGFVTLDSAGATVIQSEHIISIPTSPVMEVDPTGAGDTFCGAALAGLARGLSAEEAATRACRLAAVTVQHLGPQGLLSMLADDSSL